MQGLNEVRARCLKTPRLHSGVIPQIKPRLLGVVMISEKKQSSVLWRELILSGSAERADPICRDIFPLCSRSDSIVRIASCFIVYIAAEIADILHFKPPLLIIVINKIKYDPP